MDTPGEGQGRRGSWLQIEKAKALKYADTVKKNLGFAALLSGDIKAAAEYFNQCHRHYPVKNSDWVQLLSTEGNMTGGQLIGDTLQ
jgi:hypothetical protein